MCRSLDAQRHQPGCGFQRGNHDRSWLSLSRCRWWPKRSPGKPATPPTRQNKQSDGFSRLSSVPRLKTVPLSAHKPGPRGRWIGKVTLPGAGNPRNKRQINENRCMDETTEASSNAGTINRPPQECWPRFVASDEVSSEWKGDLGEIVRPSTPFER